MNQVASITVDDSKITPALKKVNKNYRIQVMESLADSMDVIRHRAATRHIIPRIATKERRPRALVRLQPTNPIKLTQRTGALNKMLLEDVDKSWITGTKTVKMKTNAFNGLVRVFNYNSNTERYEATLKLDIKSVSAFSKGYTQTAYDYTTGNKARIKVNPETKQTLAIRFKHDEPGIRGHKRPFLTIAAQEHHFQTRRLIDEKLARIARMA